MNKLKEQNELLVKEIESLKKQLNENTVIESMNDMKEQYEELKRESVSRELYDQLIYDYKNLIKLKTTLETINNLNIRNIMMLHISIKNDEENKTIPKNIEYNIRDISKNSRIMQELINFNEEDNECTCHYDHN